jgi:2-aminoadipate transaminase
MQTQWEYRFAQRTQQMKSSAIRELLKYTEEPDMISFAGGMPAPEVFPVEEFLQACNTVLKQNGPKALQYGSTDGYTPLREMVAQMSIENGIQVSIDNILITSGSQQALDLLGKVFINPGDRILVEAPTYLGALQAWSAYGAEYVTVPCDEDGMDISKLEAALRTGPKFIYALSNFQNPSGVTLSLERRYRLVEIAEKFGIPIVEDDPYGQLRYEGDPIPSIVHIDENARGCSSCYTGNVIYTSTFSKILAPGIRLAWIIAPTEVIQKLVMAKQGADLHTATFNQMVATEIGRDHFFDRHIEKIRKVYSERRNVMLDSLEEHMPEGISWTHPKGGLFLWATLPEGLDAGVILKETLPHKVAFVPGGSFWPYGGGDNTMRLNFSNATPEKINEGISRLGQALKKVLKNNNQ